MSGEGLRVVLHELKKPKNITVDFNGRPLLKTPLVLQCGPMEELAITRQFTTNNYDTVSRISYTRSGARQLRVWQFDTLAMYLALQPDGKTNPGFVPWPTISNGQVLPPEHYAELLGSIHDSGAPFLFTVGYPFVAKPILSCPANLLQYNESYEAGEIDAIYFKGLSFSEWRDPLVKEKGKAEKKHKTPATVTLYLKKHNHHAAGKCVTTSGHVIPKKAGDCTPIELARYFYGEPSDWRHICKANNLHGGGGHTALVKFPRFAHVKSDTYKLHIPAIKKPKHTTHHHRKTKVHT
jgi:hypothetical protein